MPGIYEGIASVLSCQCGEFPGQRLILTGAGRYNALGYFVEIFKDLCAIKLEQILRDGELWTESKNLYQNK
eukprot:167909-Hanusia_phi.AAC.1